MKYYFSPKQIASTVIHERNSAKKLVRKFIRNERRYWQWDTYRKHMYVIYAPTSRT